MLLGLMAADGKVVAELPAPGGDPPGIGICDDYSSVFVGMCRATGIPARVMIGSNHVSAEVYFPGDRRPAEAGSRWRLAPSPPSPLPQGESGVCQHAR